MPTIEDISTYSAQVITSPDTGESTLIVSQGAVTLVVLEYKRGAVASPARPEALTIPVDGMKFILDEIDRWSQPLLTSHTAPFRPVTSSVTYTVGVSTISVSAVVDGQVHAASWQSGVGITLPTRPPLSMPWSSYSIILAALRRFYASIPGPPAPPNDGPLTDSELRAVPVAVAGPLTDTQLRLSAVPVSGTFWPVTQPISGAVSIDNTPHVIVDSMPAGGAGLTDAELRAAAVPVSIASVPSHAVTGPLTDTQLRAAAVAISGTVGVSNFPASQAVTGPLTDGQLRAAAVPVSGAFWQATQPVSAATLPLPAGAASESTLAAVNTKLPSLDAGRVPVILPPGGGGLTDTELRAVPVEVQIKADDATWYIWVTPMALAANKYFLAMLNTGAQVIRVRKLFLVNAALAAVTGVGAQFNVLRITGITAGTAVTPAAIDLGDTALSGFTCVHSPTAVAESTLLYSWYTNNDEIGLTGGFPQATIQALGNIQPEGAKFKDLVLRQNQGITVKQITATTVGSYGVLAVITRD